VRRASTIFTAALILAAMLGQGQTRTLALSHAIAPDSAHIEFDAPVLAPMAHIVFCLKYPVDCEAMKSSFRPRSIELTEERWNEIVSVNASVNRSIYFAPNALGLAGEKWLIAPRAGDCNDFAVTKRHELLTRGWPSRSLLLAEVVTSWGEHHLVLIVRLNQEDFVLDTLSPDVRPWWKANYRWVRVQQPRNPRFWATIREPPTFARHRDSPLPALGILLRSAYSSD
jgi:predicted transglutaminase-like cysteine proteinase